jgi:hypothetical protein
MQSAEVLRKKDRERKKLQRAAAKLREADPEVSEEQKKQDSAQKEKHRDQSRNSMAKIRASERNLKEAKQLDKKQTFLDEINSFGCRIQLLYHQHCFLLINPTNTSESYITGHDFSNAKFLIAQGFSERGPFFVESLFSEDSGDSSWEDHDSEDEFAATFEKLRVSDITVVLNALENYGVEDALKTLSWGTTGKGVNFGNIGDPIEIISTQYVSIWIKSFYGRWKCCCVILTTSQQIGAPYEN